MKSSGGNPRCNWLNLFSSTAENEGTAASIGSPIGYAAAIKHDLQTWDHPMLSLKRKPPCHAHIKQQRGSQTRNVFPSCVSALSRLQTPFCFPLCDTIIGSKPFHTWPTAIIIRHSFCTFLMIRAPRHTCYFHTQNNTAYAECINFARAAAAW